MLVLSRKPGEKLVINNNITITILEVVGTRVRIGVEAPDDVRILRGELACWLDIEPEQQPTQRRPGKTDREVPLALSRR
ncbi:MAG TPA: carbon storage regulator [Gemmataceae bacterium]|nr:carbon storage regulator [Gemmataceae bacterium]